MGTTDFYGQQVGVLENEHIRIEYLADTGPRIVRLFVQGNAGNLLAELPDMTLASPNGDYQVYGGHRLWTAPEVPETTYFPESRNLQVKEWDGGVTLTEPAGAAGVEKRMRMRLDGQTAAAEIEHTIANRGQTALTVAAWAITQLPPGGTATLPRSAKWLDPAGLQPNKTIVLWDYASLDDPRLEITEEQIRVRADGTQHPFKIGYLNHAGWIEYVRDGVTFRKVFAPQMDVAHPDFGCNAEVYTNHRFLELETLGALVRLAPGETLEHRETWIVAQ